MYNDLPLHCILKFLILEKMMFKKIFYYNILLLIISLLIFNFLSCVNSKQFKNPAVTPNSENTGYLKLKIIDSVNSGTLTESTVSVRGVKKLPLDIKKENNFENDYDFIIQGKIRDINETLVTLKEGDYYTYLTIDDSIIRPFLVSDITRKSIHFGYKSEFIRKGFLNLGEGSGFYFTKNEESNCRDSIKSDGDIHYCKPLEIEKGKVTELILKFEKKSEISPEGTALVWIFTFLTPIPGVGAPMIVIGTIIVNRKIEFSKSIKDKTVR